jgi:hypothetical protein
MKNNCCDKENAMLDTLPRTRHKLVTKPKMNGIRPSSLRFGLIFCVSPHNALILPFLAFSVPNHQER